MRDRFPATTEGGGSVLFGGDLPRPPEQQGDPVAVRFQGLDPLPEAACSRRRDFVAFLGGAALRRVPAGRN